MDIYSLHFYFLFWCFGMVWGEDLRLFFLAQDPCIKELVYFHSYISERRHALTFSAAALDIYFFKIRTVQICNLDFSIGILGNFAVFLTVDKLPCTSLIHLLSGRVWLYIVLYVTRRQSFPYYGEKLIRIYSMILCTGTDSLFKIVWNKTVF